MIPHSPDAALLRLPFMGQLISHHTIMTRRWFNNSLEIIIASPSKLHPN
jgi:hypothetical protein